MDPTTLGVTIGVGTILSLVMQLVKIQMEKIVPDGSPSHDSAIQLTAVVLGAVVYLAHARTLGPLSAADFWRVASQGAQTGITAIGVFHGFGAAQSGNAILQMRRAVAANPSPPLKPAAGLIAAQTTTTGQLVTGTPGAEGVTSRVSEPIPFSGSPKLPGQG